MKIIYSLLITSLLLFCVNSVFGQQNKKNMQHLKFIPEEFNNIEVGFSKTAMTFCSPGYPNRDIPLNTLLINAPEKILYTMQSRDTAVVIPICIADNISLRRLHKYHKDDLIFHIKMINQEKVYSGKIYDEEDAGDRIPIPSHLHKKMIEDRDLNNKEAQKYNDDELDEGVSYPSFMNLNVLNYVKIPFQSGQYEIWYTFRGLESNHCYFDIIEKSDK